MGSRPHFCTSEDVPDKIYADPGSNFDDESSYEEIMRNIMAYNHFLSHLKEKNWAKMAINNRSTKNIEKQRLEAVVMVEELFEETELPDVVWEEGDNKKMPFYKFSAHQTIQDQEFLYSLIANWGLPVQDPSSVGSGENLSLFLTDEFFDLLLEEKDLYAA